MVVSLRIATNDKDVIKSLKKIRKANRKAIPKIINAAVLGRRGQGSVKGDASSAIAKRYGYKVAEVKKKLRTNRARLANDPVIMKVDRTPLNVTAKRGTRFTKKGVTYSSKSGRILVKGGFKFTAKAKAEGKNDKVLAIKRKGKERYQVTNIYGPSIGGITHTPVFQRYLNNRYKFRLKKVIADEFRRQRIA